MKGSIRSSLTFAAALAGLAAASFGASYDCLADRWQTRIERAIDAFHAAADWIVRTVVDPVCAAVKRVLERFMVVALLAPLPARLVAMRDYVARQVSRARPVLMPRWRMCPST